MEPPNQQQVVGSPPTQLQMIQAEYFRAEQFKVWFWRCEALASVFSIAAAFVLGTTVAAILVVVGVSFKILGKWMLSRTKSSFRLAERARRFDFEQKALGWPLPS